jgi:hypothetical protein
MLNMHSNAKPQNVISTCVRNAHTIYVHPLPPTKAKAITTKATAMIAII